MTKIPDDQISEFVDYIIKGKRGPAQKIIQELIDNGCTLETIYLDFLKESMYKIGKKWEKNEISVAGEHMATAIVEGLLNFVYPQFEDRDSIGKSIIFACAEEEHHQVGIKMVADIFESKGWDTAFVGADTPTEELIKEIQEENPNMLGLSMSIFFNLNNLEAALTKITTAFSELPILLGGQGLEMGVDVIANKFPTVEMITDLKEIEKFFK